MTRRCCTQGSLVPHSIPAKHSMFLTPKQHCNKMCSATRDGVWPGGGIGLSKGWVFHLGLGHSAYPIQDHSAPPAPAHHKPQLLLPLAPCGIPDAPSCPMPAWMADTFANIIPFPGNISACHKVLPSAGWDNHGPPTAGCHHSYK